MSRQDTQVNLKWLRSFLCNILRMSCRKCKIHRKKLQCNKMFCLKYMWVIFCNPQQTISKGTSIPFRSVFQSIVFQGRYANSMNTILWYAMCNVSLSLHLHSLGRSAHFACYLFQCPQEAKDCLESRVWFNASSAGSWEGTTRLGLRCDIARHCSQFICLTMIAWSLVGPWTNLPFSHTLLVSAPEVFWFWKLFLLLLS